MMHPQLIIDASREDTQTGGGDDGLPGSLSRASCEDEGGGGGGGGWFRPAVQPQGIAPEERTRGSPFTSPRRGLHASSAPPLLAAAKLPTSGGGSKLGPQQHPQPTPQSPSPPDGFKVSGSLKSASETMTDAANDRRALHAVSVAIKANAAIFVCKLAAYGVTGSSAMLAEAVHSVADIVNQGLLHVGISSSTRAPDTNYNYGYRRERFVWSLISAVGVFFLGSGVSVMHGLHGMYHPVNEIENIWVGLSVLGASAVIDSYSLAVAYKALVDNAAAKEMSLREFVKSGHDPTSVAVVAEDAAAVSGCVIAAAALAATQMYGSSVWDAAGSVAVGGLLGATATYLINSNRLLLLGRSLGADRMQRVTDLIRADPVVEEVYRAKSEVGRDNDNIHSHVVLVQFYFYYVLQQ